MLVPKQFRSGFIIPLAKDIHSNLADSGNYRGITISPILSKLFEHILKAVFCDSLSTSQYQFGFKKRSSIVHALHFLKETVNYYVDHGSRVFCSFLDASKAFDRLVHSGLFNVHKTDGKEGALAFLKDCYSVVRWSDL